MKVKSIFAVSLLAAGAAFADTTEVDTEYVLGVMPVTANGKTQVILSVPWVAEGVGNATTIAVTNLVKTAGLEVGDQLTWYDTSKSQYKAWRVVAGDGGVKYWAPTTIVVREQNFAAPADGASLKRGEAIVLTREGTSDTIYVVGQVGSSASSTTTIAAGKYTLVAPPTASNSAFDLNTELNVTGSINASDEITVDVVNGLPLRFVRNSDNTKWASPYNRNAANPVALVPAGRGFWYKRAGEDDLTLNWTSPATSNN